MKSACCVVYCACPNVESARTIAQTLVEEGLAACVNRIDGVKSTYFWAGSLQEDTETLLIIKTVSASLAEIQARIDALHPHELPEVIAVPINGGSTDYLNWLSEQSQPRS